MKQYIVDAFTDKVFSGNQAAVCVLEKWIDDELMQNIATENNFSETAFAVAEKDGYHLRWVTPAGEIDFCGHATLGTAFVILNYYKNENSVRFFTQVGEITVNKKSGIYEMNFPAYKRNKVSITDEMVQAIGVKPTEAYLDRDLLLVLDSEEAVINLKPNQEKMKKLDGLCIAITAESKNFDCVSRVFAPELNVAEDPVTGSTHCMIAPYWADKLGKTDITAFQAKRCYIRLQIYCRDFSLISVKTRNSILAFTFFASRLSERAFPQHNTYHTLLLKSSQY